MKKPAIQTKPKMNLSHLPFISQMDESVDKLFDRLRGNPALDKIFYTASQLGDYGIIWQLLAALRALRGGAHERNYSRIAAALILESILVNVIIKSFFERQRPETKEERPLYLRQPKTSSFPSGHASSAAMSVALLKEASRGSLLHYGILGTIISLSRIYVKIHHASDVIGGAMLGYAFAKVVKKAWPLGHKANRNRH